MGYETGALLDGRYQLQALLGEGAYGIVFRAKDIELNRDVAVKILHLSAAKNPTLLARFEREARALSELLHPGIVRVYRYGLDGDSPFLVMEYSEGENLHSYIRRKKRLPCDEALTIAQQLASALEYAHSAGVVHRDLKPENIQLKFENETPVVKVLDFGLCKRDEADEEQSLTKTGHLVGTAMYMSPEQCTGKPVDKRSDIYSFACILFEMITGSPPFDGVSPAQILLKHLSEPFPKILELSPACGLPIELQDFLLTCAAKDKGERFQSFTELRKELAELQKLNCRKSFEPGQIARLRFRLPFAAGTIIAITLSVLLLAAAWLGYILLFTGQGKSILIGQVQQNLSAEDAIAALSKVVKEQFAAGRPKEAAATMKESLSSEQFRKWRSIERQKLMQEYVSICKSANEPALAFDYTLSLLQEAMDDVQLSLKKKLKPEKESVSRVDSICREFIEAKLSKRQWADIAHVFLAKWNIGLYDGEPWQFWWWWVKSRCESYAPSLNSRDVAKDYCDVVNYAIRLDDADLVARSSKEALAFARQYEEFIRSSDIRALLGLYYIRKGRLEEARIESALATKEAEGRDLSEGERANLEDLQQSCKLGRLFCKQRRFAEHGMNGLYKIILQKDDDK